LASSATAAAASPTDLINVTRNAKSGDFEIAHGMQDEEETSLNRVWRVVSNKNEQLQNQPSQDEYFGVKISKFDVIKLGRMKFRIKDLACAGQQHNQAEILEQDLKEAH